MDASSRALSPSQIEEHNRLYGQGLALIRREILIDGEPRTMRPTFLGRRRLRRGIALLQRALAINPSWQNHFWIGKALQRLEQTSQALSWFSEAVRIDPSQESCVNEAANVAMSLGEFAFALSLLRQAVKVRGDDAHLQHNLGVACLLSGRPDQALAAFERTLTLQTNDATVVLARVAAAVLRRERRCPVSLEELASAR